MGISAMLAGLAARFGLMALLPGGGIIAGATNLLASIVNFFSTTLGRWVGVGLIGLALFTWGDVRRGRIERRACEAKIEAMIEAGRAAQVERDKAIGIVVGREAAVRMAALEKVNSELQRKVDEYESEVAKRPEATACRADPRDIERLRKL